jgi:hypothetical protein
MTTLQLFQSAGVALAIGLLVGAERERTKREHGSARIWTFALAALLGNLTSSGPRSWSPRCSVPSTDLPHPGPFVPAFRGRSLLPAPVDDALAGSAATITRPPSQSRPPCS